MRPLHTIVGLGIAVAAIGCHQADHGPWYHGDLEAARAEAAVREVPVFLDFYSDT